MRRIARRLPGKVEVLWGDIEDPVGREIERRFGLTPGEYVLLSIERQPLQKGFFPILSVVKRALPGRGFLKPLHHI